MAFGGNLNIGLQVRSQDLDYLVRELREMPQKINRSLSIGINAGLKAGQRSITKGIKKVTTIKDKDRIFKDIVPTFTTPQNLHASVRLSGRGVGATQFKHLVTKDAGVSYTPGKGGTALVFSSGFKAIGAGKQGEGNTHLFFRLKGTSYHVGSKAHHKPNIGRNMERLKSVMGPRIAVTMNRHPEIEKEAAAKAGKAINTRLLSQIDRSLNRKKADRPIDAPAFDET